jgi:seryl-tRNA synthetase
MLDLNLFRQEKGGNPDIIRESQRRRGGEAATKIVDEIIELDQAWRQCKLPSPNPTPNCFVTALGAERKHLNPITLFPPVVVFSRPAQSGAGPPEEDEPDQ